MKTASRIMYIIGIVSNIALFVFALIGIILFAVAQGNPELAAELESQLQGQPLSQVLGLGLGVMIYLAVACFIVLILSFKALKRGVSMAVHVVLLIGGILCWDIFYVLGGIFGLISGK